MSESVSRYSIIERLCKEKLNIMSIKSSLNEDITKAKQKAESLEKDIVYDKKVCQQETDKQIDELNKTLRDAKQNVKNLQERKAAKEKLFDDKIKAINEALQKLEDISKSSQS